MDWCRRPDELFDEMKVSPIPENTLDYYENKKSRGTGKAIIALARKFLGIIYRTLNNNWVFEHFANFVLAEEEATA